MKKGDEVKILDLNIGDYFADKDNNKYRKIKSSEVPHPQMGLLTLNAFHLQSHTLYALPDDEVFLFIRRDPLEPNSRYGFWPEIEELELEHQKDFFRSYLEMMEEFLEGKTMDLEERFSSRYPYSDAGYQLQKMVGYPKLLRESFFVSMYSFLEVKLNEFCKDWKKDRRNIDEDYTDLRGRSIKKSKTYLVQILGSTYPFGEDSYWQTLCWYNELRNKIVHNNGVIEEHDNLYQWVRTQEHLDTERSFGEWSVVIGPKFNLEVIANILGFLRSMLYYREADKID